MLKMLVRRLTKINSVAVHRASGFGKRNATNKNCTAVVARVRLFSEVFLLQVKKA
jgi:hypothetical protein